MQAEAVKISEDLTKLDQRDTAPDRLLTILLPESPPPKGSQISRWDLAKRPGRELLPGGAGRSPVERNPKTVEAGAGFDPATFGL